VLRRVRLRMCVAILLGGGRYWSLRRPIYISLLLTNHTPPFITPQSTGPVAAAKPLHLKESVGTHLGWRGVYLRFRTARGFAKARSAETRSPVGAFLVGAGQVAPGLGRLYGVPCLSSAFASAAFRASARMN
jgi:hypothetical protein